jgi:predicted amidophosphoribosyltransferase
MSVCPNCGTESPTGATVCADCGTPLDLHLSGEEIRRFATVVNSDLKGSTALGE